MQVDCSFDEHGHYLEQGKEWDNLTIDSISIIPPLTKDAETVYTVTADNLSSVSCFLGSPHIILCLLCL